MMAWIDVVSWMLMVEFLGCLGHGCVGPERRGEGGGRVVVSCDCHGDGRGALAEVRGWLRKLEEGEAVMGVGPKVTLSGICVLMITKHIKAIWY